MIYAALLAASFFFIVLAAALTVRHLDRNTP